jgi:hypothetical protein
MTPFVHRIGGDCALGTLERVGERVPVEVTPAEQRPRVRVLGILGNERRE